MVRNKVKKYDVKSYKTVKGRQLFFIKNKRKLKSCTFDSRLKFFAYKSNDKRFIYCSIKYKYYIENIKNAEKEVKQEMPKKNRVWSWLFLLLNIGIVSGIFIYQFATGEATGIDQLFTADRAWGFLILALLFFFIDNIVEATKTFHLIYISTHTIRPFLSYKSSALCRYYDSISPMSSAGEPYQMYYLNNRGLRGEVATSIPIVKSLFWQISQCILSTLFLVFNSQSYVSTNPVVYSIAWVSVATNLIVISTILILSTTKRFGPKLVIGVLKLLAKMHIIKNYQATFRKVMRFVLNYQNCMRTFASNFFTIILQLFLAMLETMIFCLIPFFIYKLFYPLGEISAMEIITRTIICNMVSLIIPLPGGSGGAEFSFIAMFSSLFVGGTAVWALLIWRILNYYSYIIQGIGITIYDVIIGNKKSERMLKNGFFAEKIRFSMLRRKKKLSIKEIEKIKTEKIS